MNIIDTSAFSQTCFSYLLGPTCVGKGVLLKLLERSLVKSKKKGLRVGLISFGQMIRDRMEIDPAFKAAHYSTIEAGDLLEDPKAIELFDDKLVELRQEGPFDMMLVDGFCRTVPQIGHAADLDLLRAQDRVYVIEAPHDVCSRRFTNRHENGSGRLEREMKTFTKRYHLHADNIGSLKAALGATEIRHNIIEIDARNRDRKGHLIDNGDPNVGITEYASPALISDLLPVVSEILVKRMSELETAQAHSA